MGGSSPGRNTDNYHYSSNANTSPRNNWGRIAEDQAENGMREEAERKDQEAKDHFDVVRKLQFEEGEGTGEPMKELALQSIC
jgi:hypothetical protein